MLQVNNPNDAVNLFPKSLRTKKFEECWILFLNGNNKPLKRMMVTRGSINQVTFDQRRIIKSALDCGATGIIVCHNHPSGNTEPSKGDINMTNKLHKCCEVFDIGLMDHIILGENEYYSFTDNQKYSYPK